jgi:ATP-dependent DNA ligase
MQKCRWLKPELVAQIEFTEWTPDGHLRHSMFVGLREAKDPPEVVREERTRSWSLTVASFDLILRCHERKLIATR